MRNVNKILITFPKISNFFKLKGKVKLIFNLTFMIILKFSIAFKCEIECKNNGKKGGGKYKTHNQFRKFMERNVVVD
jgi:hypothetical protein